MLQVISCYNLPIRDANKVTELSSLLYYLLGKNFWNISVSVGRAKIYRLNKFFYSVNV